METHVESTLLHPDGTRIRLLGPLLIARNGAALELPSSRKLRALLAFLALAPKPVERSQLCDLLWDVPNDPRGELRWCLSKLRRVLDEPGRSRILASEDRISVDLGGCHVDAVEIAEAAQRGIETLGLERLRELAGLFAGDFLAGTRLDRSPWFETWLTAQRRRYRSWHANVLEQLVGRLPPDSGETLPLLETWVELAPFDQRPHLLLLGTLAEQGRIDACEEHLAAASRLFVAEDLDFGPIRDAWRALKDRRAGTHVLGAVASLPSVPSPAGGTAPPSSRRASLAVMPFVEQTRGGFRGGLADGLTHDIITRLARLRSLFVIARGSVFALAERGIAPEEAGRRLNVDYVAGGTVRQQPEQVVVSVELIEARTARIVWAETFERRAGDAFSVLDEIGNRIVSSIANEIETAEKNLAILKPPSSLDAWEAYHRGLWHMYRFTQPENDLAQHFFQMSVGMDPTFARAYAGLSFTHWQSSFQHWGDRQQEADKAFEAAGQSLIVDDHDPAAHWAMGRALWLHGRLGESLGELERAVDLSPNFALGHYALSFVQSQSGDPAAAIAASDHSRQLSPFDPLLFGMLGARAMAHVRLGEFEEAAEWALKAAARPNAHPTIMAIAAHCLALAGRIEEARGFAATLHRALPHYGIDDFLATFRFERDAEALFRQGARRIGLG